jgi:putative selenium metabolism hydrolase
MIRAIDDWVKGHRDESLSLLGELIRIPSLSRQEMACGECVAEAMHVVGFDSVRVDSLGDAMGTIKGSGGGRSLLLNGHIDHVPPGDMPDPYSGKVMDGSAFGVEGEVVYGRSASDMKAAVAAMVLAGGALSDLDVRLKGDYRVAAVAQEEVGGAGTVSTIERDRFLGDVVLVGEATNMGVALGHRGSMKMSVVVKGRSCHASAPERGINALYKATDLIARIREEIIPNLPTHPIYGRTSLTVTVIGVKPGASNVVPEECEFTIDCRNGPDFPAEELRRRLEALIEAQRLVDPELQAAVIPPQTRDGRGFTGFYTDPSAFPVVAEASSAVGEALGREPKQGMWAFATDGRFYSWLGLPVIGFGPGEERFTHTIQDHVRVSDFLDAIKVYAWLACRICGVEKP